jgi:hypothetical protein
VYRCSRCGREFNNEYEYIDHITVKHIRKLIKHLDIDTKILLKVYKKYS